MKLLMSSLLYALRFVSKLCLKVRRRGLATGQSPGFINLIGLKPCPDINPVLKPALLCTP